MIEKIHMPGYKDVSDNIIRNLFVDYSNAEKKGAAWSIKWVSINSIVPTQDYVSLNGVDYYAGQKRFRNAWGNIPSGVRFKNDRRVYLNDGHHRLFVAKCQQRKRFRVIVFDLNVEHP